MESSMRISGFVGANVLSRWAARVLGVLAAFAVLLVAARADAAPTKSFTAATASLPSDIEVLGTSNLKTLKATDTFKKLFPELLKSSKEANEVISKIKKNCGVDPVTAFDDVTLGIDKSDDGAVFLATNGLTEQKVVDCFVKIGKGEGAAITSKKTGNITELKSDKTKNSLFFAWLTGDVLVVATEPENKALLERMLNGKGAIAKGKLGTRIAKADPSAALVVLWAKQMPIDKMTLKTADLTVTTSGGNVNVATTLEMGSSKEAENVASVANSLPSVIKPKGAPKELEKVLKSVSAKASGAEVKITAAATEKDLVTIAMWGMGQVFGNP